MSRICLLYTAAAAEKNRYFIQQLRRACQTRGIEVDLRLDTDFSDLSVSAFDRYDLFVNRSGDHRLARALESCGKTVSNPSRVTKIANDKTRSAALAKAVGISMPEQALVSDLTEWDLFPCVVKSPYGRGGTEVYYCAHRNDFLSLPQFPHYLVQQFIPHLGDVRVYVFGNEIAGAVLRRANGDFRANIAQGGVPEQFFLSQEQAADVHALAEELAADYVGIDFLWDGHTWFFNEAEDPAGARGLYRTHAFDIADRYIAFLRGKGLC